MGRKAKSSCKLPARKHNPEIDAQCFSEGPDTRVAGGSEVSAVFFPGDAHMPVASSRAFHRVVAKTVIVSAERRTWNQPIGGTR